MDLSSIKNYLSTSPSLLDYLSGGNASSGTSSDPALQILGSGFAGDTDSASGDTVTLSAAAQQLLAQINGSSSTGSTADSSSTSGVTKAAQNFVSSFFKDSGVDTTKLSDDVKKLLQGFQDLIANSGTTGRDTSTDVAEAKYSNGDRQVYTLTGTDRRIRLAVDYKDGKPQSLTITDISNDGEVDKAIVSLTSKDGALNGLDVAETQYKYTNGALTDSLTKSPMSLELYS